MAWQAALALALLCSGIHALEKPAGYADFTGDKVLRFTPTTQEQIAKLRVLRDRWTVPLGLDWWRDLGLVNHTCDLRVPPAAMANVSSVLHDAGIVPTVMIEDLQAVIDAQFKELRPANESAGFDLSQYHDLSEVLRARRDRNTNARTP